MTVYFIIHASISLQIKVYSSKFVIKFFSLAILPFLKIHCGGTYRVIHSSIPQPSLDILTSNLTEKLFLKNGMSQRLVRNQIHIYKTIFIILKSLHGQISKSTIFHNNKKNNIVKYHKSKENGASYSRLS